jgi:hypothetical protein
MMGLHPGTLWFDPSNPAQMKLISDQLAMGQQAPAQQQAAPAAPEGQLTMPDLPRSSGKTVQVATWHLHVQAFCVLSSNTTLAPQSQD